MDKNIVEPSDRVLRSQSQIESTQVAIQTLLTLSNPAGTGIPVSVWCSCVPLSFSHALACAGDAQDKAALEWHVLCIDKTASDTIDQIVDLCGSKVRDVMTTLFNGSFKPIAGSSRYKNLHAINHAVQHLNKKGFLTIRINNMSDNIFLYLQDDGAWVVRNSRGPILQSIEAFKDRPEDCVHWRMPRSQTTLKVSFVKADDALPATISTAKMRTDLAFTANTAIAQLNPFIPGGMYHLKPQNTHKSQFTRSPYASGATLYGQNPHASSEAFLALTFEDIDGQPALHFEKKADGNMCNAGKLGHWVVKNHLNQVYARSLDATYTPEDAVWWNVYGSDGALVYTGMDVAFTMMPYTEPHNVCITGAGDLVDGVYQWDCARASPLRNGLFDHCYSLTKDTSLLTLILNRELSCWTISCSDNSGKTIVPVPVAQSASSIAFTNPTCCTEWSVLGARGTFVVCPDATCVPNLILI
jgi:hypothetical protein